VGGFELTLTDKKRFCVALASGASVTSHNVSPYVAVNLSVCLSIYLSIYLSVFLFLLLLLLFFFLNIHFY